MYSEVSRQWIPPCHAWTNRTNWCIMGESCEWKKAFTTPIFIDPLFWFWDSNLRNTSNRNGHPLCQLNMVKSEIRRWSWRTPVTTFGSTLCLFLADRTNGPAYDTVLRPSVRLSSVTYVLWLNGASYRNTLNKQIGRNICSLDISPKLANTIQEATLSLG